MNAQIQVATNEVTNCELSFYFFNSGRDGGKKTYRMNYTSLRLSKLTYNQHMPLITCKLLILMFKSFRAQTKFKVLKSPVGDISSKLLPCCVACTMVREPGEAAPSESL